MYLKLDQWGRQYDSGVNRLVHVPIKIKYIESVVATHNNDTSTEIDLSYPHLELAQRTSEGFWLRSSSGCNVCWIVMSW